MAFLDEIRTEGISLTTLKNFSSVAGQAEHWEKIQKFLTLVSDHWDAILKDEKCVEPVTWQRRFMDIQADLLERDRTKAPIMIAGSLGTIPSTARLIKVISTLKNGVVILPGLQREQKKEFLSSRHPQFFLHRLLKKLNSAPEGVRELPSKEWNNASLFLEKIFDSRFTGPWILPPSMENIQYIETSDQGEEARIICISIRKALEEGKKKILCISSDPKLLHRVSAELGFWSLSVSVQKKSLLDTQIGSFLHLATLWFSSPFPTVVMASTFKHSFVKKKKDVWNLFEKYILRTWVGNASLLAIEHLLERESAELEPDVCDRLKTFYETLKNHLVFVQEAQPLGFYLDKLESLIAWLLGSETDLENLFLELAPEEGVVFQQLWQDLKKSSALIMTHPKMLSEILFSLLQDHQIPNVSKGNNESIFLMSPAEARFMEADFKILAGLNEGTWPAELRVDPFFSSSMRETLGLPSLETRFSQSAHDFLSAICIPVPVLITRSLRVGGVPSVPSRFLSYLEMRMGAYNLTFSQNKDLKVWARNLNSVSQKTDLQAPRPLPPVSQRPKRLSVTDVSILLRDPYSIYAKHILKLTRLEPFIPEEKSRLFGLFVHNFLHRWAPTSETPMDVLLSGRAKFLFELYLGPVEQSRFLWEKFSILFEWVKQQKKLANTSTEIKGEFSFAVEDHLFTLFGKADRVDWDQEGAILIDYKTGSIPPLSHVKEGKASQITLEALIFLRGGFSDLPPRLPLRDLQYWGLLSEEILSIKEDLSLLTAQTQQNLEQLISSFYKETTPYLSHPKGFIKEGEYDHLARLQEWSVR
ncbi:MAG: hypothetical protein A2977_03455 [Alphaproteobacteria bacterium RIFCSPLOWO2_01_FULL_45_8]|nr:MAG: hypothetical protein A2977_03455 [Alphaproteobacteria bacterium RIFCSPLOWO2_01_FULL_45_8]